MRKLRASGPAVVGPAIVVSLALSWACGSSSGPPGVGGTGPIDGSSGTDGTTGDDGGQPDGETQEGSPSGDSSTGDNGDGTTQGGDSGTSGPDGSAPTDAAVDVPLIPAQCPQAHAWAQGTIQFMDQIDRFGGMTPDGLTAAWIRPQTGDGIEVDRATPNSTFTTQSVLLPGLPQGVRPALSSTGDLVFGIVLDGLYTQIWTRADSSSPWEAWTAMTTPFDAIVAAVNASSSTWSEPAFGASGDRLFYVVTFGQPSIYESTWNSQTMEWDPGVQLPNPEFKGPDALTRRRPTGASADGLTLFFFDEVSGVERAAWRVSTSAPFTYFEDLPGAAEASPSSDCTALYFVTGGPLPGTESDAGTIKGGMGDAGNGAPPHDAGATEAGPPAWNGSGTSIYVAH